MFEFEFEFVVLVVDDDDDDPVCSVAKAMHGIPFLFQTDSLMEHTTNSTYILNC